MADVVVLAQAFAVVCGQNQESGLRKLVAVQLGNEQAEVVIRVSDFGIVTIGYGD